MPQSHAVEVPARAALAGNPSDGFGGAVVAVPVPALRARVVAESCDRWVIDGIDLGSTADVCELVEDPSLPGLTRLAVAAIDSLVRHGGRPEPSRVDIATTIPESVGLAGSSAVVIGVLRALALRSETTAGPPDRLAEVALSAEVDGLGIAAGLQDRIVQSHGVPMHMEFAEPRSYREVRPHGPVDLLVAARPATAASSGATHTPLRDRFEEGDADVRRAMTALAAEARRATAALEAGDHAGLGAAMDMSFDLRRSVVPLDPGHVEMIEAARDAGASANYAGSGGSVVALVRSDLDAAELRASLAALGCELFDVSVQPSA